jgi:mannan endo-1,4-beta-mannosidase
MTTRIKIRFILIVIFITFNTLAYSSWSIITSRGLYFYHENQPFYYLGTNSEVAPGGNRDEIDYTFEKAANLGCNVIRIWAVGEGFSGGYQPLPGIYNETTLRILDYKLDAAKRHGIRLIITLLNNWSDYGGAPQYVKWVYGSDTDKNLFWTNSSCKTLYKNYVAQLINRTNSINGIPYKTDPTVFAWELCNEPRNELDDSGVTLNNWITEMSSYIKSIDTAHMVSIGSEGLLDARGWYATGVVYVTQHQISTINFCTFHIYPNSANWSWASTRFMMNRYISWGQNSCNKPVIMEEYGLSTGFMNYGTYSSYQLMLHEIDTAGGAGSNIWYWDCSSQDNQSLREILRANARLNNIKSAITAIPDLDIQPQNIWFSNPTPAIGSSIWIIATVENKGTATASNVITQFWADNPLVYNQKFGSDKTTTSIAVSGFAVLSTQWTATGKATDIYVTIDPNSTITELSEYNNLTYNTISGKTAVVLNIETNYLDWSPYEHSPAVSWNTSYRTEGNHALGLDLNLASGSWSRAGAMYSLWRNRDWTQYAKNSVKLLVDIYIPGALIPLQGNIILQVNPSWDWHERDGWVNLSAGWNTLTFTLSNITSTAVNVNTIAPEVSNGADTLAKVGTIYIDNIRLVGSNYFLVPVELSRFDIE